MAQKHHEGAGVQARARGRGLGEIGFLVKTYCLSWEPLAEQPCGGLKMDTLHTVSE